MIHFFSSYFNRLYWLLCSIVFIVITLRAFFIPFSHDEASTFFFYIQNADYMPYEAHAYTNNHFLNSFLSTQFYHLLGSHRFVLRLPNVISFLVLCFGVFRFFKHLIFFSSKVCLITFFILTFNFLDFFEICRGYGLSLAFMVLGLSYLHDYFNSKKLYHFFIFSLCWQLALSANLTLVVVLTLLFVFILIFQLKEKLFLSVKNILIYYMNTYLLILWIELAFYYKNKGLLDSGVGEDYWKVSFESLISFIYGTNDGWLQVLVVFVFIILFISGLMFLFKKPFSLVSFFKPKVFYVAFIVTLIINYFLQKKILGINYPEDRTGLFFYIFFALSVVFLLENFPKIISNSVSVLFLCTSCFYFSLHFNLKSFSHYFYHIVPKTFYEYLENELKQSNQLFTIGGNQVREMNFAYLNYRGNALLNPMSVSKKMQMNCDYYIALQVEKPYYNFFYDEVAFDTYWNRVLLKRKQKIKREPLLNLNKGYSAYGGNNQYFEFIRFADTNLVTRNCLEADIELKFNSVPKPFKAFVVFQVNDSNDHQIYYERLLLNWISDDLNGKTKRFKINTGPLPKHFKEASIYLWNINFKECNFELNYLKLFKLEAPGINLVIPENFYPLIKQTTNYELI